MVSIGVGVGFAPPNWRLAEAELASGFEAKPKFGLEQLRSVAFSSLVWFVG